MSFLCSIYKALQFDLGKNWIRRERKGNGKEIKGGKEGQGRKGGQGQGGKEMRRKEKKQGYEAER